MTEELRGRRRKHPLLERGEYALYRAISWPLRRASRARVDAWSAKTARMVRRLLSSRDRLAASNMARVFPEKTAEEREALLDACWRHFASLVFGFVHDAGSEPSPAFVITGREGVDEALQRGRGVIIVTAHYGDWERAIGALDQLDVPVCVVARKLDNRLLESDLYRIRTRSNVQIVDRRRAARPLYKTLEARGAVVVLADQAVKPREGTLVPFLGLPAWTTPAPARLSLKTGAPVVVVWCENDGDVTRIDLEPPIDPDLLSHNERNAEWITRKINDAFSARIRRRPELWLWMHDRWKGVVRSGDSGS